MCILATGSKLAPVNHPTQEILPSVYESKTDLPPFVKKKKKKTRRRSAIGPYYIYQKSGRFAHTQNENAEDMTSDGNPKLNNTGINCL